MKFKYLLSSTCLTSSERRVLNLESEVMIGLGSIPTGGNIHWIFLFSHMSRFVSVGDALGQE